MLDTIIKNGTVVTQNDKREILNLNIGIKDGKIEQLGNDFIQAQTIIDASNCIITPAYVNGHIHFGEYYLRGYKGKLTTEDYIRLGEKFYSAFVNNFEEIRSSSINNVLYESVQNGTLTVFGVRGWPNVQKFGVNAYLGYPIMRSNKLSSYIDNLEKSFNNLKKEKNVEYFLGLHSLKWMNEDDLKAVMHFMDSHKDIKISLHVCETKEEVMYFNQKYKASPIEILNKFDLLTENTLLVHCNYLSDEDIEIIRQSKASVAVCHCSNLKLGNVPCDIKMLLKCGINVMIATDGPATSDSLSLLDAVKVTALISSIDLQSLYDMITINPAKYMKIHTGSIQVGNMADILFYDKNSLNITYKKSILENLVYLSNKPCNVMKEGVFIVNNYKFNSNIGELILYEKNRIINLIEDKLNVLNC